MQRTCGTCDACIPACPTGAIVAPGVLDARRCLAAIFQSRGPIPVAVRESAGVRVYGCDDCLTACPPGHQALQTLGASSPPDGAELLARSDAELDATFAHWYVPGRSMRFIRRNAIVAVGNGGSANDLGLLGGYLGHPDALLRGHAAWAIGRIGGELAEGMLDVAARGESDATVSREIALAREMAADRLR
jgi:epoxyqueuosine reductase